MANRTSIPKEVGDKIAKGSDHLGYLWRECKRATEPQTIAKAEKEFGIGFLLEVYAQGRETRLGISREESDAMAAIVSGRDYEESPDPTIKESPDPRILTP